MMMELFALSDHPRACGANVTAVYALGQCVGSSPRVRGKRCNPCRHRQPARIIPARAGQTWPCTRARTSRPDHPRACGANPAVMVMEVSPSGSSPRVRGKPFRTIPGRAGVRIIPARAGQTLRRGQWHRHDADHPRACGANLVPFSLRLWWFGSSPRVRGKLDDVRLDDAANRIIPARAGHTYFFQSIKAVTPDHPRACGANCRNRYRVEVDSGSSPRVRGKPRRRSRLPVCRRIIPARAGQTRPPSNRWCCESDHPRACGANPGNGSSVAACFGSSPRVRGKQPYAHVNVRRLRIIPARAGQT